MSFGRAGPRQSAATAMSEAEASSAGRDRPTLASVKGLDGVRALGEPSRLQRCFALMTFAPLTNS